MPSDAGLVTPIRWPSWLPSWQDLVGGLLLLASAILLVPGAHAMVAAFAAANQPAISLSPTALPGYTLRTMMRMLAALVASLIFTFTYATLAAKSRRAEMVLIPLLDALQSVPILGYLSFNQRVQGSGQKIAPAFSL